MSIVARAWFWWELGATAPAGDAPGVRSADGGSLTEAAPAEVGVVPARTASRRPVGRQAGLENAPPPPPRTGHASGVRNGHCLHLRRPNMRLTVFSTLGRGVASSSESYSSATACAPAWGTGGAAHTQVGSRTPPGLWQRALRTSCTQIGLHCSFGCPTAAACGECGRRPNCMAGVGAGTGSAFSAPLGNASRVAPAGRCGAAAPGVMSTLSARCSAALSCFAGCRWRRGCRGGAAAVAPSSPELRFTGEGPAGAGPSKPERSCEAPPMA